MKNKNIIKNFKFMLIKTKRTKKALIYFNLKQF